MHAHLLGGDYLQADETPIKCHDPDAGKGAVSQGYLWLISRPGGDVVFDWKLSRRHGELTGLAADFKGVLQADGYEAYDAWPFHTAQAAPPAGSHSTRTGRRACAAGGRKQTA